MRDYTKELPVHVQKYVGERDLFLEIFEGEAELQAAVKRPPLLFVHGAYSGSWMWSKYIPHFASKGWKCYAMNMRSHYRSRVLDLTSITFEDYLEDIREIITECGEAPILIGHSMGGLLGQKLAETTGLAGLVLVDSSISREVNEMVPDDDIMDIPDIVLPAPCRKPFSKDETEEDVTFQVKYLTMESAKAVKAFAFTSGVGDSISINSDLISCPCLVIKAVGSEADEKAGRATAKHLRGEYAGLWDTTHTGLLVGQRYHEAVEIILKWLRNGGK